MELSFEESFRVKREKDFKIFKDLNKFWPIEKFVALPIEKPAKPFSSRTVRQQKL